MLCSARPLVPWLAALALAPLSAFADTYAIREGDDLVGELQWVEVGPEDTLADIAVREGLGFREVLEANPQVDPWLPAPNSRVLLPRRYILPSGPREGIVINQSELRLYYYKPRRGRGPREVMTFPVALGRDDWKTPLADTQVTARVREPTWYPPESIRREHAEQGEPLPLSVPPGPDNPLGPLLLRLGIPGYLLHGTNKPYGIGMPVTHGCVRMYNEHMRELFDAVTIGTPVRFVDEPVKLGRSNGILHVEAHPVLREAQEPGEGWRARPPVVETMQRLVHTLIRTNTTLPVDWRTVETQVADLRGVPVALVAPAPEPATTVAGEPAAPAEPTLEPRVVPMTPAPRIDEAAVPATHTVSGVDEVPAAVDVAREVGAAVESASEHGAP